MILQKNEIIDGKYKVLEFIDSGGFGEVYKVKKTGKNKIYALKIMPIGEGFDVMEREAKAVMGIDHPNVVKVFDFNKSNKHSYIVMTYMTEGSLADLLLRRTDYLTQEDFILYAFQILKGLAEINKVLVHRDLKPQNILFDGKNLKISDFGLSRYVEKATRTHSFKGLGTYAYMAPETWEQKRATPATDIYSIGIIFYELLTLSRPFSASNAIEWRKQHLFSPVPHLKDHNLKITDRLDAIIKKMMSKDAASRYQTAEDVMDKIKRIEKSKGASDQAIIQIVGDIRKKQDTISKEKLEGQKHGEFLAEERRKIWMKCEELFCGFDVIIDEINNQLEQGEIVGAKPSDSIQASPHNFREYSFSGRIVEVIVFHYFEGDQEWNNRGVYAVGYMRINDGGNIHHGSNLLLMRKQDDLYGSWKVAEVRDSSLVPQSHRYQPFSIDNVRNFKEHFGAYFGHSSHITSIELYDDVDGKFKELISQMIRS